MKHWTSNIKACTIIIKMKRIAVGNKYLLRNANRSMNFQTILFEIKIKIIIRRIFCNSSGATTTNDRNQFYLPNIQINIFSMVFLEFRKFSFNFLHWNPIVCIDFFPSRKRCSGCFLTNFSGKTHFDSFSSIFCFKRLQSLARYMVVHKQACDTHWHMTHMTFQHSILYLVNFIMYAWIHFRTSKNVPMMTLVHRNCWKNVDFCFNFYIVNCEAF